ncbi:MAG TPA: peroxiredoxin family protein [Phycisphaerae bacterium]|jgi:peroxiredoxin|nr:peroxiredoxin family protein [Phycisphaerae bacterium]
MSESSPTTASASTQPRSLLMLLLPLVPIVIAIGIGLGAKYFPGTPGQPATATATGKAPGLAVGALAPDFSLPDVHKNEGDEPVTLSLLAKKGPVLVVFILGYNCHRCIAHLQELDSRRAAFEQAGVQIIAVTPDTLPNLRDSIDTYGDIAFPFLSDVDAKVARAYGLRDDPNVALHGTFLVDTQRRVAFAAATEEPFTDLERVLEAAQKLQTPRK